MFKLSVLFFSAALFGASASALVATDVIRAGDQVTHENAGPNDGGEGTELYGREVRRTVYSGQTISASNTRPARIVERNQIVTLKYVSGLMEIAVSGRAMSAAAVGEPVRVLNTNSRNMIQGTVQEGGWVLVQ